jgi:hypothetical protein
VFTFGKEFRHRSLISISAYIVSESLPGAGDVFHLRLTSELSLRADFESDTSHLVSERTELVDHRIDGVLEFENLALHVDFDLLREVTFRDGRGDLSDRTHSEKKG